MASFLSYLSAHGMGLALLSFTIISIALGAVAQIFVALGKQTPGWIGTAISWVGTILHYLNGNISAPTPSQVSASIAAVQPAVKS
jgi:hypothetical protein